MSFGKQSLVQGGGLPFAEGGFGRILYARWVSEAPDGYTSDDTPLFLKVAIEPTDKDGNADGTISLEHYRAGSNEDFIPVNAQGTEVGYGTDIEAVGGKQGLNNSTKFAILLDHFIESGLPEDHLGLDNDTSQLDGLLFAWQRIPEPEGWGRFRKSRQPARRRGQEQEPERERTILVPAEWHEDNSDPELGRDPEKVDAEYAGQREEATEARAVEEASQGSRKRSTRPTPQADGAEGAGTRKRGKARASQKAADNEEAAPEPATRRRRRKTAEAPVKDEDDVPFDAANAAVTALKALCDADGEVAKRKLKLGLLPFLRDAGLTAEQSGEVVTQATSNDFLEALDESSGLDWDGKTLAALVED